jgi:hypothetical protein
MKTAAAAAAIALLACVLVSAAASSPGGGAASRVFELQLNGRSTASKAVHVPSDPPAHVDSGSATVNWRLRFRFRPSRVFSWSPARGSKLWGKAHFDFGPSILSGDCRVRLPREPFPGNVAVFSPTLVVLEIANPFEWLNSCGPGLGWFLPSVPFDSASYAQLFRARWLRLSFNPEVLPTKWASYRATWPLALWDPTVVRGSWRFQARMRVVAATPG